MPSIFNAGGRGATGDRMINHRGVVTRELPLWKLTLTGADLPESGHVMTSMSYNRLHGTCTTGCTGTSSEPPRSNGLARR